MTTLPSSGEISFSQIATTFGATGGNGGAFGASGTASSASGGSSGYYLLKGSASVTLTGGTTAGLLA